MTSAAGVETRCAECGEALPAVAKFCLACGAEVEAAPSLEMRKTVTLLFCDVSGSTAMGEQLDPEALRSVMGRYFEVASAAVQAHGGTVEKFVGDAVLAVFGIPEVREDDALRAVRAAVQLRDDLTALSDELEASAGVRLAVRTGVNTGSVVAGAARAGGSFATGDAVNTAARLEQAAAPGEVLIGESTLSLVRDAVEVGEVQQLAVKGKADALPAYRLLEVLDTDRGRRRRLDASLVGRDRELRALLDALTRTREDGRSQLLTVLGAAGMGKTRLVAQLLGDIGDDVQVLRARCLSYGRGITFWPVVQLLRQAAGLSGEEDEATARTALGQLLLGAPDAAAVVERVLPLLGLGGEPGGNEETFWAVRVVLEHLAAATPTLVVLDDIHWAEPTLLDLVEQVRDEVRDVPLLMLCLARPELLEARPGWGGGALNAQTFSLEPISAAQTSELLAGLLGPGVPSGAVDAIDAWAGGNPLFVEEVATHLVESGLLAFDGSTWNLTGDLSAVQIPASVSALLAARLDRLPGDERALVERVSVIGLEFTTAEAAALAQPGADVPALLASLARRDVVRRTRGARADTWAFRHVLVREAAYEANPKALRAELHERYAERLEAEALDAGGEGAAFVGHHLEQAACYRLELAPGTASTAAVAQRAVAALTTAAVHAQELEDERAAFGLVERALALHPTGDALLALLWLRVDLAMSQEQFRTALESVAAISELPEDTVPPATRAVLEVVELEGRLHAAEPIDPAVIREAALRAAAIAADAGDRAGQVRALKAGQIAYAMAERWEDLARYCDDIERFGSAADRRHARHWRMTALQFGLTPATQALAAVEELLARPGIGPFALGRALTTKAVLLGMLGRHEEAAAQAAAGEEQLAALTGGTPSVVAFKRVQILVSAGDEPGALASLAEGIEVLRAGGGLSLASTLLAWRAALLLGLGSDAEVAAAVEEAATITSPHDVASVSALEACRAVLAARRGDHEAAQLHLRAAREAVAGSDALVPMADVYRWLSEVPARAGDVEGQRALLREALERYRAKGHLPLAERTERMLADLDD